MKKLIFINILNAFFTFYINSAYSWTSGDEKNPGPPQAKIILAPDQAGDINEHARIMLHAFKTSGISEDVINSIINLNVYVLNADSSDEQSLRPANFQAADKVLSREFNVAGLAGLADHSYSLWDWLGGNEVCPLGTTDSDVGAVECHTFTSHMGAVNSNHFGTQAANTYKWYHQLALHSARECKAIKEALKSSGMEASNESYVKKINFECEVRTYVYEAFGQHFLQDAWAVGHMWERWGAPDLRMFRGSEGQERALLVAATAGLLHGAEPLLKVTDSLSSGQSNAFFRFGAIEPSDGIGDLHLNDLNTDSRFSTQMQELNKCAKSGVLEVRNELNGVAGPLEVVPVGDECFGQRITYSAFIDGWGLTYVGGVEWLLVPFFSGDILGFRRLSNEWRDQYIKIKAEIQALELTLPLETPLRELPSLLNVEQNNVIVAGLGGAPPAPFSDPSTFADLATPPHIEINQPKSIVTDKLLKRVLNRAHIKPLCEDSEVNPEELRERVTELRKSADPTLPVACSICTEFASRHIEVKDSKSMCEIIGAEGPTIEGFESKLILSPLSDGLSQVERAATEWCGCQIVGATLKVHDARYGNFKANISGLSGATNPILFSITGSPGNTCGGEMGGAVYSSKVFEEGAGTAFLYPGTRTSGVAERFSATANRRTCSSFIATRNWGTENEQLWINVAERAQTVFSNDREYQLRFYSGNPENREDTKRCEIGSANVPFGNYFGTPLDKCDYELLYDGLPL